MALFPQPSPQRRRSDVECRANKVRAKQVPLPFYKRPKK